jgi:hypothetical protein
MEDFTGECTPGDSRFRIESYAIPAYGRDKKRALPTGSTLMLCDGARG